MPSFQISFKNVPKPIVEAIIPTITIELAKNGWEFSECTKSQLTAYENVSILFGEKGNQSEWNIGVYTGGTFTAATIYHVINDWDKWTSIKYVPRTTDIVLLNGGEDFAIIHKNGDVEVNGHTFGYAAIQHLAEKAKKHLDNLK
jgi:hypothetical protein